MYKELFGVIKPGLTIKHGFSMLNILLHPKSRGTIRLQSKDPLDYPVIDPHYMEHPDDVKTLIKSTVYIFT
jgi:choline dehydrogenase-like flavoprotein